MMPILATGNKPRRFFPAARGFTLIELLVVIALIAIAMASVGLSLRDGTQATLDREGERLAALLESARAQSRVSGVTVRWRPTGEGFVFDGLPPDALPTRWLAEGIHAQPALGNGRPTDALLLGPDPIIAAQLVVLTLDGAPDLSLVISSDGLHPFALGATP